MRNIFADTALHMPPEPYDHVVAGANGAAQFLTSDQCVGCHAAGATGLRFDMTVQTRPGGLLVNLQDRFCTTGNQPGTERLYAIAGYLQLDGTQAAHWKLALVSSGVVSLTK
jgi:hypothetical protein